MQVICADNSFDNIVNVAVAVPIVQIEGEEVTMGNIAIKNSRITNFIQMETNQATFQNISIINSS